MQNSKPSSAKDAKIGDAVDRDTTAAELLARRRARTSILYYANAIEVPGRPVGGDVGDEAEADDCDEFEPVATPLATHHRLIVERVEATSRTPLGKGQMASLPETPMAINAADV